MPANASKLDNNKIRIQHNIIAITEISAMANQNTRKGLTDQWEARTVSCVTQFITFWAEWCCQATHKTPVLIITHRSPPNSLHSPQSSGLFAKLSRGTGARQSQQIVSDAELWSEMILVCGVPGGNKVVAIKQNHITTLDTRVNWD